MIGKLLPRNTFLLALIVLFGTICILSMNLFAEDQVDTDHDNMFVNDTESQTSLSVSYYGGDYVSCSAYGNTWNFSNIPVRYYFSASHSVLRKGRTVFRSKSDSKKGWVQRNDWISFLPSLDIDMRGGREGDYTANGSVSLELKFDFNGDGTFEEKAEFGSSASIDFEY